MEANIIHKESPQKVQAIEELLVAVEKLPAENTYQVLGYAQGMLASRITEKILKVS